VTAAVDGMLRPGLRLTSLRLRRAHFKPGQKLALYYDAAVDPDRFRTPLAVTWWAGRSDVDPRLASLEQRILASGVRTPFTNLWRTERDDTLLITVAPLDPVFPSLLPLVDARPGEAPALSPGGVEAGGSGTVAFVRYRPGQRHVLAYRRGRRVAFAKLYRPGESQPVASAVSSFADATRAADSGVVQAISLESVLDADDALLYAGLPGVPLSRHLRAGRPVTDEVLLYVGRWLRAVHSNHDVSAFPHRVLADESRRALRACAAMRGLSARHADRAAALIAVTAERLDRLGAERAALVHGDMKAEHVLCAAHRISVLDTDGCAAADPALDLGKLLADLRWWAWLYARPDRGIAAEAALLDAYMPSAARLSRARLWAALFLVKMAGRRVSVARRDWRQRTAAVLDLSARALEADRGR